MPANSTDNGPVFIGGLDRSGKTLLRMLLSSHSRLAIARRTHLWTRYEGRFGDLNRQENFDKCLDKISRQPSMRHLNLDPQQVRNEFLQGERTYPNLFAIIYRQYAESIGKPRWGDQLAFIEKFAEKIFAAYPSARIIHMIRDPRQRFAEYAQETPRRWPGRAGQDSARWLYSTSLAHSNLHSFPGRYMVLKYETLVSDTEEVLRELCDFIGESFEPAMLSMESAHRFGEDGAQKAKHPTGKNKSAACGMTQRELLTIQALARREMKAWGYPLQTVALPAKERLLHMVVDWPASLAGMFYWRYLSPGWLE